MQVTLLFLPGQIFVEEPQNVTVPEGVDVFFPCSYQGISGVPTWRISKQVFISSDLPPKHSFNGSGLIVHNVDLSLNMTSYSCFFSVYQGGGTIRDIESRTGFLIIAGLHIYLEQ